MNFSSAPFEARRMFSANRAWLAAPFISLICWLLLFALPAQAQEQGAFERHLASGEFTIAGELARAADDPQVRDQMLVALATAQRSSGVADDAFRHAIEVSNDGLRAGIMAQLGGFGSMPPLSGSGGSGPQDGPGFGAGAPRGGGITAADFTDLIELIQETIDPESWEANGGTGRIRSFPAGVLVDPNGVLKSLERDNSRRLDETRDALDVIEDFSLVEQTPLRAVSLTRLERALQLLAAKGQPASPEMQCLGGIYQLRYVMIYPETRDVVIAGPAGPWHYDATGRAINSESGRPVLNLDDFVVCLRNATSHGGRFGCSIDPRPDNLAAAREFIRSSTLKGAAWRDRLRDVIGQQDVVVDGINPTTHAAQVIVTADWHMKRIGMGLESGVDGLDSYFARLALDDDGNPPRDDSLVRWWFTMHYDSVKTSDDRTVFEINGPGVRLMSESEFWDAQGQRVHTGKSSPAAGGFAADFNRHFDALCEKYPVYGELRNLFDCALAANIIWQEGLNRQIDWKLVHFQENPPAGFPSYVADVYRTPRVVDSIMGQRVLVDRSGSATRTHTVSGISGGVECNASELAQRDRIVADQAGELAGQHRNSRPDGKLETVDWTWDAPRQDD